MKAPLIYIGGALKTARLTLEPLTPEHAEAMFAGFADPRLYTWLDVAPPHSVADLRERFQRIAQPYAPNGELWLNWPLRQRRGKYAGLIEATMRPDRVAFLAYFVFPAFARQGLAREACTIVIDHLFRAYDAVEIRAEWTSATCRRAASSKRWGSSAGPIRGRRRCGRPALDYRRLKRPSR